jgi:alanine racemase
MTGEYVRPTRAILDLRALENNYRAIQSLLPKRTKILSIVKANAYGHGISTVAKACSRFGAVGTGVADLSEALELRRSGFSDDILCMGATFPEGLNAAGRRNLIVTLHSADQLPSFLTAAKKNKLRIHLKLETGMHRLGLDENSWGSVARKIGRVKNIQVEGILTHLAESANAAPAFTQKQIETYRKGAAFFERTLKRKLIRHASNSGAIFYHSDAAFDWVRPGIAMYGYPPDQNGKRPSGFLPVLSWKAPILQVKRIAPGDSVGYNRAFKATKPMTIATVACGYGDGFLRRSAPVGVGFRKKRIPVLGIICMDLFMIDVTRFSKVAPGEEVTLLGPRSSGAPDAYELAEAEQTIPYEILTSISSRVTREN